MRLSGGRPERPLLLTVSRLAPEKNVGFLADVLKSFPNASLAVVGDGPARADLERQFQGLDARFIGYLKGEQLAAAYASADAFVYASETETMGNVVLEAMAAGCAVVAPRAGGIPNLMDHGATGFLFQPGDRGDAVNWTGAVLDNAALRSQIGAAARQDVEERNWAHSISRVRQAYVRAIEQREGAPLRATWREQLAQLMLRTLVSLFCSAGNRRQAAATPLALSTPVFRPDRGVAAEAAASPHTALTAALS
jgi:glycosyltransferase involved in cell wall biosynthesis